MRPTTSGRYRVLESPRERPEILLVDVETNDPTYVATGEYENDGSESGDGSGVSLGDLRPGYLVDATLSWDDEGTPRVADLSIVKRTLFEFVDDATGIFEAARETWEEAVAAGEGMNSQVTLSTDGEPNGVVYVFADQPGARDVWEEFRSGVLPIEPLVDRLSEFDDCDHEVFVMRPREEPYVLVYLVRRKGSVLADTMRDTYDCQRPAE